MKLRNIGEIGDSFFSRKHELSPISIVNSDWLLFAKMIKCMILNLLQDWGLWIDYAFLLMLGGIPWQCYYQRVLSSKTSKRAVLLSYGGGLIALIMTIPSVSLIYHTLS